MQHYVRRLSCSIRSGGGGTSPVCPILFVKSTSCRQMGVNGVWLKQERELLQSVHVSCAWMRYRSRLTKTSYVRFFGNNMAESRIIAQMFIVVRVLCGLVCMYLNIYFAVLFVQCLSCVHCCRSCVFLCVCVATGIVHNIPLRGSTSNVNFKKSYLIYRKPVSMWFTVTLRLGGWGRVCSCTLFFFSNYSQNASKRTNCLLVLTCEANAVHLWEKKQTKTSLKRKSVHSIYSLLSS